MPCGHGTTPDDPVGCRGVDVPGHTACLAHLADAERDAYLHSLTPGTNIDHSGTTFTEPLLDALLDALRDPATGYPRVGDARFISATFEGTAEFDFATFQGEARFRSAIFKGDAVFGAATFQSDVGFRSAIFKGDAVFEAATFERTAEFRVATFQSDARFAGATFQGGTWFTDTTFQGNAEFEAATFQGDAWFVGAVFGRAARLGPLVCAGRVMLSGAVFDGPVTLSLASRRLECRRTRWSSTAEIRLRYATVDFAHAVFEYPLTIAAEAEPFVLSYGQPMLGAGHIGPAQLAPVYRALRKSFEDGKDEPGAAVFYYGEMEMRRHDRTGTTRAERGLLHGYWLLSGYGLRASRALGWLAATMLLTIGLLMGCGLPKDSPKQEATGTVPPGGGRVIFEIDKADPQNPTGDRFTGERFDKALNVTLNSVVFRSSGQDLTTTGTYFEMASRVIEPILLGLAVLAVRNRVKR
ncbi:pentapeptide repeat-containing protein [Streptomyces sp. NPDC006923]|uniref:pentapeptide repeat-containing protein n=1 Tax=Streptomyces sp. NPDC006923 TaxID=3155355 RepID=UPI0033F2EF62